MFGLLNDRLLAGNNDISRKARILILVSLYLIAFSVFLTIIGQLPYFSTRGITQVFQLTWIFVIVPVVLLSYKYFLKSFLSLLIVFAPFLIYLFLALLLKINSLSYEGTTLIFLSFYIFLIGKCLSPYFNKSQLKLFAIAYLIPSLVYAVVIYFEKLRGVDISGSIYAVSTKNSTGPILLIAALFSFIIFDKKNVFHIILKIAIIIPIIVLVALMKCRTVLLSLPICLVLYIFIRIKNVYVRIGIFVTIILAVVLIIVVPSLNERIIHDILFNGKTTIDEIFSGRISQTIRAFSTFKPVFGSGGTYIDCMPLSFLATYGIVGFLGLLFYSILPFVSFISISNKEDKNKRIFYTFLIVIFIFQYLFEGYGYFGPGAKAFVFWLIGGLEAKNIFKESNSRLFRKIESFSSYLSQKTTPLSFSLILEVLFVLLTLLAFPPNVFSGKISEILYRKIPSTAVVTDYNQAANVKVYSEILGFDGKRDVLSMCNGQRIKLKFKADNNYDDIFGFITSHNESTKQFISIDTEKCEVKAIANRVWTVFSYYTLRERSPLNCYVYISDSPNNYSFNAMYIALEPFKESFQYTDDVSIQMGVGSKNRVYYDNFYVPDTVEVKYFSSDTNVAVVDEHTGEITGKGNGNCYAYSSITNSNGTFISKNKININVDSSFVECEDMEIDYSDNCYQYIPFSLNTVFNDGATDTRVAYCIEGLTYHFEGNKLVFEECGNAHISIYSVSNPLLYKTIDLEVKENHPVSFSCSTKMVQVGNVYSPKDVGLYINYSNGQSLFVSDDVLAYSATDRSGRAWYATNGMVRDHCSFKTIKTGNAKLSLTCRYDENIKETIYFDVIKYTPEEYDNIIHLLVLGVILTLNLACYIFTMLVQFKKRYIKSIIYASFMVVFSCLSMLSFGVSVFTLICFITNLVIGLIFVVINQFLLKDSWPHIFDEFIPDIGNLQQPDDNRELYNSKDNNNQ